MTGAYLSNQAFLQALEEWGQNVFELLLVTQPDFATNAMAIPENDAKRRLLQQIQNQPRPQEQQVRNNRVAQLQALEQQIELNLANSYQQQVFIPYIHVVQQFGCTILEQQLIKLMLLPHLCREYAQMLQALAEKRQLDCAPGYWPLKLLESVFTELGYPIMTLKMALQESASLHHWQILEAQPQQSAYRLDNIVLDYLLGVAAPQLFFIEPLKILPVSDTPLFISEPLAQQLDGLSEHCASAEEASFILNLRGTDSLHLERIASSWLAPFGLKLAILDVQSLSDKATHNSTQTMQQLRRLLRDGLLCNYSFILQNASLAAENRDVAHLINRFLDEMSASYRFSFITNGNQKQLSDWVFGTTSGTTLLNLFVASPDYATQVSIWQYYGNECQLPFSDGQYQQIAGSYLFDQAQILQTIQRYQSLRLTEQTSPWECLLQASQQQTQKDLNNIASLVRNQYQISDIVLPQKVQEQLGELLNYAQYRHQVVEQWGFDKKNKQSKNLCAVFHGPSGTGKTMAASVIANELNQSLYRIDLSSVMSKYIGETEKNLAQLFDKAEAMNVVLFFDEAESLFGKRTQSKDSHDRYANLQTGYLLQRIEQYQGVVILSTNLLKNIDSAFIRRFKFIVEFPFPDARQRLVLWQNAFPENLSLDSDVDLNLLSEMAKLTGGSINNIVVKAAFLAAAEQQPLGMRQILKATEQEYRKQGKVYVAPESQWLDEEDIW